MRQRWATEVAGHPRPSSAAATLQRRLVRIRGLVQGVGFRPFVYSLASELSLAGRVWNTGDGVRAEVQGQLEDVESFCARVRIDAPPLAVVENVDWTTLPTVPGDGFVIDASAGGGGRTLVPPDVATCPACLAEFRDPTDRRYRHPFITCTACGPRFTIVTGLPYDRPSTTMAGFPMCPDCAREYSDPADRRFHAQPISCHACGPRLELLEPPESLAVTGTGARADRTALRTLRSEAALARARELLRTGAIVAVKGLGGYHLACDATNPAVVAQLRERKHRGAKPFAILVPDLAAARAVCRVDEQEAALLTSARRPIVLLRRLGRLPGSVCTPTRGPGLEVAEEVAPGNPDLGVMLPPTALHHLLFEGSAVPEEDAAPGGGAGWPGPRALILTSGNLAGEPLATDDAQAVSRLAGIADAWLRHDRPIHVACDDSVTRVVNGAEVPLRRSRGYAPLPVPLPFETEPLLAVGGDVKNTFALAQGRYAWLSAHVGDLDDLATQEMFTRAVQHLSDLVGVRPRLLVADLHPGYRSVRMALRHAAAAGLAVARVQHHHAHVAAVMAEHGLDGSAPVIGVSLDGTGYGTDGAMWGGEVLLADYDRFRRFAHLAYVPLAGGDATVRRPYRMALAHLQAAGLPWADALPCVAACPSPERRVLAHQLATGLGTVATSSVGRLFDAVASITGICHQVDFEAEAAMAVEAAAVRALDAEPGSYRLPFVPGGIPLRGAPCGGVLDGAALVRAVVADVLRAVPAPVIAARFHRGLAEGITAVAEAARADSGTGVVALSGGVFANATLLRLSVTALCARGFTVLRHRKVPCNDGGLALGQIAVAGHRLASGPVAPVGG